jgi:hypothetical protein
MNMTFQQYEELAREIPNSHYGLSHYEKYLLSHILEMAKRGQGLEVQRDYLAKLLGDLCTSQKDAQCPLFYNCPASNFGWSCGNTIKEDWIYAAEESAKEAGE